jgi:hypothetical protein
MVSDGDPKVATGFADAGAFLAETGRKCSLGFFVWLDMTLGGYGKAIKAVEDGVRDAPRHKAPGPTKQSPRSTQLYPAVAIRPKVNPVLAPPPHGGVAVNPHPRNTGKSADTGPGDAVAACAHANRPNCSQP